MDDNRSQERKTDLTLRPVERKDLPYLYRWNNQIFYGDWQSFEFQSERRFEKRFEDGGFNTATFQMLILEDSSEAAVGVTVCEFPNPWTAEIGLTMLPEFRNRGLGKCALQLLVKHLFDNYPIVRIAADTDVGNHAAQKLLRDAGFRHEGTLRKYRFHHGKYQDSMVLGLLREEYDGTSGC